MSEPSNHSPPTPPPPSRRSFFAFFTYFVGAVAGVVFAVPFVAYLLGALRKSDPQWVKLAPTSIFPEGETRLHVFESPLRLPWEKMPAMTGVHVRNLGQGQFVVFAINCTHLGCPVTWFPQSGLFMCPCHGGVYYENGDRASGPPPRGLYRCVWEVRGTDLWIEAPHLPTLQDTLRPDDRDACACRENSRC